MPKLLEENHSKEGTVLVLDRFENQQICIGPDITVTVVHIRGRGKPSVRLAIKAPPSVFIHRQEIAQRIAQEAVDGKANSLHTAKHAAELKGGA